MIVYYLCQLRIQTQGQRMPSSSSTALIRKSPIALCAGVCLLVGLVACSYHARPIDQAIGQLPATLGESSAAPKNAQTQTWSLGGMATAANPYATEAAAQVLRAGGHAVDAAIAAHTVLGLVEPQSSGIGGGAFMLVYDRASGTVTSYNGRETAPASIDDRLFANPEGEALEFVTAWQSGLAVGVPGSVATYAAAHADHGRLPWAGVFTSAIELANAGFEVSPRLAGFLPRIAKFGRLDEDPGAAAYFYPEGKALEAGALRKNPDYARTLTRIAQEGPSAFYTGSVAAAIVASTQQPPNPGSLTLTDLADYSVNKTPALCTQVRTDSVCTATPPSSGLAVPMILGLYDELVAGGVEPVTAFVDAQRLAYADRDHYIGDPAFSDIPITQLLNPRYLAARAKQRIPPAELPTPGDPGASLGGEPLLSRFGADRMTEQASTTHLSIVDTYGNAVAMTASVEAPFGNSRFVEGFLLNNQLTDFRRPPDGVAHANSPAAGKRPRSSMSPVIALDEAGQLSLVTGSPGGNSIIAYVAKSVIGVMRWQLDPQAAIDYPNIVARGAKVRVETASDVGKALSGKLNSQGYLVQEREGENSGLHLIMRTAAGLSGAADPRREGTVIAVPDCTGTYCKR